MPSKHSFLTGTEFAPAQLEHLLHSAEELRQERYHGTSRCDLKGKTLVLLFEKPSLRTHISFSIAMQELGGNVIDSFSLQRKEEEPEDVARVLAGYCHALMVRTHEHALLERMSSVISIPVINGLSDTHHPCQVLADLLTLKQKFGILNGLKLAYIGDGNNILHSLLLLLPPLGVNLSYACPEDYQPNAFVVKEGRMLSEKYSTMIQAVLSPQSAVKGSSAIYTDVWTSMGFEKENEEREEAFDGFQVNEALYEHALPGALVLHCLPMNRGKEITDAMADHPHSALFQQSENRLHVQKALLLGLLKEEKDLCQTRTANQD